MAGTHDRLRVAKRGTRVGEYSCHFRRPGRHPFSPTSRTLCTRDRPCLSRTLQDGCRPLLMRSSATSSAACPEVLLLADSCLPFEPTQSAKSPTVIGAGILTDHTQAPEAQLIPAPRTLPSVGSRPDPHPSGGIIGRPLVRTQLRLGTSRLRDVLRRPRPMAGAAIPAGAVVATMRVSRIGRSRRRKWAFPW